MLADPHFQAREAIVSVEPSALARCDGKRLSALFRYAQQRADAGTLDRWAAQRRNLWRPARHECRRAHRPCGAWHHLMGRDEADLGWNHACAFDGHSGGLGTPRPARSRFRHGSAIERTSPLYAGVEDALASATRLAQAARTAGVPVLFTTVRPSAGRARRDSFYRKVPALRVFDEGSPLGAFPPALAPLAGEVVIVKQYASAFVPRWPRRSMPWASTLF